MSAMLDAAMRLACSGWAIFPLVPNGKEPIIKGWPDRATTDASQVRRWWARYPRANIGIACGANGLIAVDLDVKDGARGLESWITLCDRYGLDDLETVTVSTPSGGTHVYFRQDGAKLRNSTSKLGPGIDTRGIGGYVVAPPSVTPQGHYVWGDCTDIAPLPHILRHLLEEPERKCRVAAKTPEIAHLTTYVQTAITAECGQVSRTNVGSRNRALNTAAFSIGTLVGANWTQLDYATARDALLAAGLCSGLGELESANTIKSGLEAGRKRPRPQPGGRV